MSAGSVGREWVGRVIDGKYPLTELLGGSGTSSVFVTELSGPGSQKAVVRLSEAGPAHRIVNLSHPHLAAILDSGQATADGVAVEYVVSEYAEEVLSQILPERALTPEEAREMLAPVLEALGYLHGKGFVHGHLKPSHVLVIGEHLKLSADQIEAAGQSRLYTAEPEIYDAPESGRGAIAPAEDLWSLGVMLVEALTQRLPEWERAKGGSPAVPVSMPSPFAEIARRCLEPDPARRCTLEEVKALLEGKAREQAIAPQQMPRRSDAAPSPSLRSGSEPQVEPVRVKRRVMPLVAIFVVLLAIIGVLQMRSCGSTRTAQVQRQTSGGDSQPAPAPAAPDGQQGPNAKGSVAQRVMPDVSEGASRTIHGTLKVVVRATVDANGTVEKTEFQVTGPSRYFARVAEEAARSWRFKPTQANGRAVPSVWLLRFEFRSDGDEASATEQTP